MKTKINSTTAASATNPMKCPICNKTMIEIVYGMPNSELWKKAKQKKAFIGGCCVFEHSPRFHCYNCRKSFSEDLKTSIDENDDWLLLCD